MANLRDKVWATDDKGKKWPAEVQRAQTFEEDGETIAKDSYDEDTVDVALHKVVLDENPDDSMSRHSQIQGGLQGVKRAKTAAEQAMPKRWWPRTKKAFE